MDDRALVAYRVRVVSIGVQSTVFVLAGLLAYRLSAAGRAIPMVAFTVLWLVTASGAVVAWLLPWARLLASNRGLWLLYAWSAVDIVLISVFIAVAEPDDPLFFLLYVFTTIFFAASYPLRGQVGLFGLTAISYLIVLELSPAPVPLARFGFQIGGLAVVAFMASFMSRELIKQTTLYESLVQAQSDLEMGVGIVDLATERFLYVNDALCRIYGYSRTELLEFPSFLDLAVEEQQPGFRSRAAARLRGVRTSDHDEATIQRKDGSLARIEMAHKPLDDSRLIVLTRDITARRAAEDERERSMSLLEATLESTADGILVVDTKGRIVAFNERFLTMWLIPTEIVGTRDDDKAIAAVLDQLKDPNAFLTKIRQLYESDSESFDVLELRDGRVFERWSQPQRLGEDREVVGRVWSFRDVTDRVTAERDLVTANAALRRADRERRSLLTHLVEAKEEERKRVASDIHDDSVQVMTSVAMGLERITRKTRDPGEKALVARLEEMARASVSRLRSMVFNLRPPSLDEAGLGAALRLYLEEFQMETGITFELASDLDVEPPSTTRTVLYRIVQEALTNVRKHSHASAVKVSLSSVENGIGLHIEDDGVGFSSAAGEEHSTRHIGLVEMRERAEIVGGHVNVRSEPDEGTAISVWVPDQRTDIAVT